MQTNRQDLFGSLELIFYTGVYLQISYMQQFLPVICESKERNNFNLQVTQTIHMMIPYLHTNQAAYMHEILNTP